MQKSILGFFSKAPKTPLQPKSDKNTPDKSNNEPSKKSGGGGVIEKYPPGTLLWSKLPGYPWWPSMVCNHPTDKKTTRKGEIHVQFLDTPVTRSWVPLTMIKRWGEKVLREGEGDKNWEKGVRDAEKVAEMSNQERLDTLLVDLLPSDEEWSEEDEMEVSPGSKENKPGPNGDEPEKKRRRIIQMDSDDSDNDESFQPSKNDLDDNEEDDDSSGASEGEPTTGEDEPDSSPVKGSNKRKMTSKNAASSKKGKGGITTKSDSSMLSTPVGKFASGLATSSKASPFSSPSGNNE